MYILLLLSSICFAEDVISLKKGEKAPYSGTLLSPSATAELLAVGESDLAICNANATKEKALLEANLNLQFKNKEAELAACTLKFSEYEKIYLDQIKYLEKRATTPDWKAPVMFAGGVVTGIAVVMASAWAINQVGDSP